MKKKEISPLCIKKEKSLLREKKNERKKNRKFQKQEPHNNFEEKNQNPCILQERKTKQKKFANQQIKVRAF